MIAPEHLSSDQFWIVEPSHNGHRMTYNRLLIAACLEAGLDVRLATTAEARTSDQFVREIGTLLRSANMRDIASTVSPSGMRRAAQSTLACFRILHSQSRARAFVPEGDLAVFLTLFWAAIPIKRKALQRLTLLIMRDPMHAVNSGLSKRKRKIKELAMHIARAAGVRILCLAPAGDTSRVSSAGFARVSDPAEIAEASERRRAFDDFLLPRNVQWASLVGSITARKNPATVIQAFLAGARSDRGLLIAGKLGEEIEHQVHSLATLAREQKANVVLIDEYLSGPQLDGIIENSTCTILTYQSMGPSGIAAKALALGTQIITESGSSVQTLVQLAGRIPFGITVDSQNFAGELRAALEMSYSQTAPRPLDLPDGAEFGRFIARYLASRPQIKPPRRW